MHQQYRKKGDTGDRFTLTDSYLLGLPGCNLGLSLHSINMGINCQFITEQAETKKYYAKEKKKLLEEHTSFFTGSSFSESISSMWHGEDMYAAGCNQGHENTPIL